MCNCVQPGLTEDQPANNFVEVNAVIQRQFVCQAHVPQECHQVAEDEDETHHRVEEDGPPWHWQHVDNKNIIKNDWEMTVIKGKYLHFSFEMLKPCYYSISITAISLQTSLEFWELRATVEKVWQLL